MAGQRPQPQHQPYTEPPSEWDVEENTHMISKLGYVPRESRGDHSPEYFDTETVTAADRSKFRTRKRAKRSSPVVKILVGVVALLLVGGIGFGVWALVTGGDEDSGDGLTYSPLAKPCDALDSSPIDSLADGKVTPTRDEVSKNAHSSEQYCDAGFGKDGGSLSIHTQVFKRDAGAKNAYKDSLAEFKLNADEAEKSGGAEQVIKDVDGVGTKAFSLQYVAAEGSKTVDYMLGYYDDNAYIEARVTVFNGAASDAEVAKYAKELAGKYMDNWAAA